MEINTAVSRLGALAHPTRLETYRLLVQAGPTGLSAGRIAELTGSLANTLSANLAALTTAGLVRSRREGRSIIYSADFDGMGELLAFLVEDCCSGAPEICSAVSEALGRVACCAAAGR